MPIKIKLPHNVRVTCPTPETAITILRSITFRTAYAEMSSLGETPYPNSNHARPFTGAPTVSSGRPFEGEGFMAAVEFDEEDDVIVDAEEIEEITSSLQEDEDNFEPGDEILGSDPSSPEEEEEESELDSDDLRQPNDASSDIPEVESPDETENIEAEVQEFQQFQDEWDDDLSNDEDDVEQRKRTTRSRFSAELETNNIYQPVEYRAKDCTRRVFDFIQGRLMFTTKDVKKYAKHELGMKMSDDNKQKIKDSLKLLEKAGLIEKCHNGEWRKVS